MRTVGLGFFSLLALVAVACSSSSSGGNGTTTPCNQDPWECSSAQTCWPSSTTAFTCLNAGPGKVGDSCQSIVGQPSCGAGLACLQLSASAPGSCVAYCSTTDTSHACSAPDTCEVGQLNGTTFSVCVPPVTGSDAGMDSGGTDSGAGGDTGTTADTGAPVDSGMAGDATGD